MKQIHCPELAQAKGLDGDTFSVVQVLHGGMGTCLKLKHEAENSFFALKLIRHDLIAEDKSWQRFVIELKIWFELSSCDGVVEAICLAKHDEIPCMCSPWMSGGTLQTFSQAQSSNQEAVFKAVLRILHTLRWAHSKHNVVHRDLKPANILFDESSVAYVSDWGLARIAQAALSSSVESSKTQQSDARLTQQGTFLGTILYASPEQLLGLPNVDFRSDIYSIGCILYELEVGRPPFLGNGAYEIAQQHLHHEPKKLGSFFSRTKYGLESIIARSLRKKPEERFQSYDSLIEEIEMVAEKRNIPIGQNEPKERYYRPKVGENQFAAEICKAAERQGGKGAAILDFREVRPYLEEFHTLVSLGRWKKALPIAEAAYFPELCPPNVKWHLGHDHALDYALCLVKCSDAVKAVNILAPLENCTNIPAEFFVNYSLALLHIRKYSDAERICRKGIQLYSDDKDVLGNLVIALRNQKKLTEALSVLGARLKLGRDVHFLEEAASVLQSLGDECGEGSWSRAVEYYGQAMLLLQEAKVANPRFTTARCSLAQILKKLMRDDEALDEFSELVKMCGRGSSITEVSISEIADLFLRGGSTKECLEFSKKWLREFPDSIFLQRVHAAALTETEVMRDGVFVITRPALEFFERITTDPEKVWVEDFCYLADLYGRMQRFQDAAILLQKAEEKFPNQWLVPYYNGIIAQHAEDFKLAVSCLGVAASRAPMNHEPLWKMAQVYRSMGDMKNADSAREKSERIKKERVLIVERWFAQNRKS